jgi:hypothetical protein
MGPFIRQYPVSNLKASGVRFQVSAQPPAKPTAGLIQKETLKKKRISNIE